MSDFKELELADSTYQPFVIISPPRTGTHMLRSALLESPGVVVHHELFSPYSGAFHPYPLTESVESILKNYTYRSFHPEIKAVGFPINEHHANKDFAPQWEGVWKALSRIPRLKVIHLWRENLLRAFVSRISAIETHQWAIYPNNAPHHKGVAGIKVEPKALEKIFVRDTDRHQHFKNLYKNQPQLDVVYERMCNSPGQEFNRVQAFLGLEPVEIAPTTRKQAMVPLSEALEDYQGLKQYFANTPWGVFFEE